MNNTYALRDACERFNISLKNAAIQFPYSNPNVSTCILGMNTPSQVDENVKNYENKISHEFWSYLIENKLIDSRTPLSKGLNKF